MRPLRWITITLAAVASGLLLWRVIIMNQSSLRGATLTPELGTVGEFSLTDHNQQPFGTKELKGKIWVADFVFTRCMGPCPMLTTKMSQLQREFPKEKNLHFVSFSVDPEFDTPEVLTQYATNYGADLQQWTFLTGPKEKIYGIIRSSFHLAVEEQPDREPSITDILHSLYFVLVDEKGKIVGYFNSTDEPSLNKLRAEIKDRT